MIRILLTVLFFITTPVVFAQVLETQYYIDKYLSKAATAEDGKFVKTITRNEDGTVTTEVRNIKKDEIVRKETFRGDEPMGIWQYDKHTKDYQFDLIYSSTESCKDSIPGLKNYFENNDALKYIAPKIATGEKDIATYIGKHLEYPYIAIENNLEGRVELIFTITENGKIENIIIKKGVHVVLDKEAVKLMREIKFSTPPLLNGEYKKLCISTPITFRLE